MTQPASPTIALQRHLCTSSVKGTRVKIRRPLHAFDGRTGRLTGAVFKSVASTPLAEVRFDDKAEPGRGLVTIGDISHSISPPSRRRHKPEPETPPRVLGPLMEIVGEDHPHRGDRGFLTGRTTPILRGPVLAEFRLEAAPSDGDNICYVGRGEVRRVES